MIAMSLSAAASAMHAKLIGDDAEFRGVSTDTRSLQPQNLFVALVGERFDGHEYVATAAERGAAAATVSRQLATSLSQLQVADTRVALGQLAAHWRRQFDIPVIGITGSNGKTTVKEMVAAIFAVQAEVLATRGNLNNDVGVPLTLFGLDARHQVAVIEMGANHAGEIEYLTRIAAPSVGVVNNAGPAHLEGFGSLEGVAQAKGELFRSLTPGATAVINADDPFADTWRAMVPAGCSVVTFGLAQAADVTANLVDGDMQLITPAGQVQVRLPLLGRHNRMNALAAAAVCIAAGVTPEQIAEGLAQLQPVKGRLQLQVRADGLRVIDDSYNANPSSARAAVDVLMEQPAPRCLVLGDMGELGDDARQLHAEVGRYAREQGVESLYTLGELAAAAAESFGSGAVAHDSLESLLAALHDDAAGAASVLVKGSRSMRMERVVEGLFDSGEGQG